jgi:hypothetical protein
VLKKGAPAGKRSVPDPCLFSAKEGRIERRKSIFDGSPALSHERTAALDSRGIHSPVRARRLYLDPADPDTHSEIMGTNKKSIQGKPWPLP